MSINTARDYPKPELAYAGLMPLHRIVSCLFSLAAAGSAQTLNLPRLISEHHVTGAVVAFFAPSQLTIQEAGSLDPAGTVPVTRKNVFAVASLGKPVFAYGVLKLVHAGRLDLDRPLVDYLPVYEHDQNPELGNGKKDTVTDPRLALVTARMVLRHSSGLPNWSRGKPLTFERPPDWGWVYSGEAYIYLQRVIEKVTGMPLTVWMRQTVFEPLAMQTTSFELASVPQHRLAVGTDRNGRPVPIPSGRQALASSSLLTTLEDYCKFLQALLKDQESTWLRPMFDPTIQVDAEARLWWGLGIGLERMGGQTSWLHWGANPGFQSLFWVDPKSRLGVLLLTNSERGLELAPDVVFAGVPGEHPSLHFRMLHPEE